MFSLVVLLPVVAVAVVSILLLLLLFVERTTPARTDHSCGWPFRFAGSFSNCARHSSAIEGQLVIVFAICTLLPVNTRVYTS